MSTFWRADKRGILVLTGTDVHPFQRLCVWADDWARDHPEDDVVVQRGSSDPTRVARSVSILTPSELEAALAGARVVVTHGGPGTISTVRASGLLPVVVPRDPGHGEHVDDHQTRFATWAGERGLGTIVTDTNQLADAVESAASAPRTTGPASEIEAAVTRIGELLDELGNGRTRRRAIPLIRVPQLLLAGRRSSAVRRRKAGEQ